LPRFIGSPLFFSRNDGGGLEELNLMRLTVGAADVEAAVVWLTAFPSSSSTATLARFLVGAARGLSLAGAFAFFFDFEAGGGGGAAASFVAGVFDPGSLIVSFLGAAVGVAAAGAGAGAGAGGGAGEV
jgi:hypothetical protein